MKKSLFAFAVTIVALASCTNKEVTEIADSNVIKFDNAFVGKATRASIETITAEGIDRFYVMGTKNAARFCNNVEVYKKEGKWGYDDLKQWEAATYAFAAYSDGGSKINEGVTFSGEEGLKIANYKVNNGEKKDLIMAVSTTNLNEANIAIEYTFKHALAMIKFTLNSGLGSNNITISELTVKGIKNTGTFTLEENDIVCQEGSETIDFVSDDFVTTQTTAGKSDEMVVIPQKGSDLQVTFNAKVQTEDGEVTKVLTANIASYEWKSGLRYNYEATITGTDMDIIEFADPKVDEWPDYTDGGEMELNK